VHHSTIAGSGYAYAAVLIGVFITALYSFRMFFLVFHGEGPRDDHAKHHLKESPKVVTIPLVMLAIPSVGIGYLTMDGMLFGDWFKDVLFVLPQHDTLAELGKGLHGPNSMIAHGFAGPALYLALAGLLVAWFIYTKKPEIAETIKSRLEVVYRALDKKYWFDEAYQFLFAGGSRGLGKVLWDKGDRLIIDDVIINGSARTVGRIAGWIRHVQTGYLFHYAIAMILGLLLLLTWFVIA
jgi:NADH-quinone oxidoreductase subunit L